MPHETPQHDHTDETDKKNQISNKLNARLTSKDCNESRKQSHKEKKIWPAVGLAEVAFPARLFRITIAKQIGWINILHMIGQLSHILRLKSSVI